MKKINIFFIAILIFISPLRMSSQCFVNIDSVYFAPSMFFNPDTINICLGSSVDLYAYGACPVYLMANNFNDNSVGDGWSSDAGPMFNNPCGPGPDGTTYLWIGDQTNFPRSLNTVGFEITTECQICFDMRYAVQGDASPCEGPDLATEGVHLQWSLNQNGPWQDINYYHPQGGYDPIMTSWNQYCEDVPASGILYFRWYQNVTSGNDYDHWGLDNVQIFCPAPWQEIHWSENSGIINQGDYSITVQPNTTTTYYVHMSDSTNMATSQVVIQVYEPPVVSINGLLPNYCSTDPVSNLTGNPTPGVFSGPGIVGNTFNPALAGQGTHTITYHHFFIATNPSAGVHTIFFDNFSSDLGWTGYGQGGWARGPAIGGGACTGPANPSQDRTQNGDNIHIGTYMGGCYENSMSQAYFLTSPVINCQGFENCKLEYWSHSACQDRINQDRISVETNNGTNWQTLWMNPSGIPLIGGQNYTESTWTLHSHDIPNANNNPNFQIRFGIGPTNASTVFKGWNIDDVRVRCSGTLMMVDTLCDFITTQNVTIGLPPTSNFSVISPICVDSTTVITFTGSAPPGSTFNWNFAGGTVVSGSGAGPYLVRWNTDGTYNITLTVIDNGCASVETIQPVVVLPFHDPFCCVLPIPNAGQDASVCANIATLTATPSIQTGIWTSIQPGAQFSNQNSPVTNVQVTNYGVYDFIYTEIAGPGCLASDTVRVRFTEQPTADAGTDFNICALTAGLNASPSVGNGLWTSNNANVTFAPNNSPTASVTVPSDGEYTFTWTEDNGNGCTSSDQVVIRFARQPIANAGPDTEICNLTTQLQATPSYGTGTWTFNGPGSAAFANANSASTQVTVSLTGWYNFIWTENNGLGCIDSDTVRIRLTQTPNSTFTKTNIACFGGSSTITYTGTGGANANYTWDFNGGNAVPGTGQGPHTVTWNNSGTYNVSLRVSLNGCESNLTTVPIVMPEQLTATIQGIDVRCFGETSGSVLLNVQGGTPHVTGGAYTYNWNNGYISQNLTDVLFGNYSVTVTDANGCSITRSASITQPPQLSLIVTPSQTICPGESAELTIFPVGGIFPYEYFWNGAPSATTISVSPNQTTTYSAYIIDSGGCQSSTVTTTVSLHPPLSLTAQSNIDSICPGEPVLISYTVSGGAGPPYTVTGSDGNYLTSPYTFYPHTGASYTITAKDICNQTKEISLPLHIHPSPPNAFLADTVRGCQPLKVQFIEINPDQGQSYVWDFGDNTNLSLAKNPVHVYNQSGIFDVTLTVTSNKGCKTVNVHENFITVYPKPNALFVYDPSVVSILKPIVRFTNMSEFGNNYIWSFGANDSSNIKNPTHNFPGIGTFPVSLIVITDQGCKDTAYAKIEVRDEVTFYAPNAFSPDGDGLNEVFYVQGHGIDVENFYMAIYDRWGQIIWETNQYNPHFPQSTGWDGTNKRKEIVKSGTYTWFVVFSDFRGNKQEHAGVVTVIR